MSDIYSLFNEVKNHPDFVGGTIFTTDDIPEGIKLPDDFREKDLSNYLAQVGNQMLDDLCLYDE
jgi:hypothetical protein